jgi:hypothetical protein
MLRLVNGQMGPKIRGRVAGIELLFNFTKSRVFTVLPTFNQMNWSQLELNSPVGSQPSKAIGICPIGLNRNLAVCGPTITTGFVLADHRGTIGSATAAALSRGNRASTASSIHLSIRFGPPSSVEDWYVLSGGRCHLLSMIRSR